MNILKFLTTVFFFLSCSNLFSQVEKAQSVNLEVLGLQYNYEQPLAKKTTVNFHGGLAMGLGYSQSDWMENNGWYYSLRGVVGADFRYYYNISKRDRRSKNTYKNSANFLAADIEYYTPSFAEKNSRSTYVLGVTPYWGLRRVYRNNILIEVGTGYTLGVCGGDFGGNLSLKFKVGYSF